MVERAKDGRWLPGKSANPNGRKPGRNWSKDFRDLISEEDLEKLARSVVSAAVNGDMKAAELTLKYSLPAAGTLFKFHLPTDNPPAEQLAAVKTAMSNGQLSVELGSKLLGSITRAAEYELLAELRSEAKQLGLEEDRLTDIKAAVVEVDESLRRKGYR